MLFEKLPIFDILATCENLATFGQKPLPFCFQNGSIKIIPADRVPEESDVKVAPSEDALNSAQVVINALGKLCPIGMEATFPTSTVS